MCLMFAFVHVIYISMFWSSKSIITKTVYFMLVFIICNQKWLMETKYTHASLQCDITIKIVPQFISYTGRQARWSEESVFFCFRFQVWALLHLHRHCLLQPDSMKLPVIQGQPLTSNILKDLGWVIEKNI